MNPTTKPCVVCGEDVTVDEDFTGDVLCIVDFFTEDPTEP